jgi:hypothetical protein
MWKLPRSWSYGPYTQRTGAKRVSGNTQRRKLGFREATFQDVRE